MQEMIITLFSTLLLATVVMGILCSKGADADD